MESNSTPAPAADPPSDAAPPVLPLTYDHVAGRNAERISALSDGLFAIAMTLLIIELTAPAVETVHSEGDLWRGLAAVAPRLLMYVVSFMTLGIFWIGQEAQLHLVERSDRHFTWINLAFLATVALFPFTTALMAEFLSFRLALAVYWLNILLTGATLYLGLFYATRAGLLRSDPVYRDNAKMLRHRIVRAQSLYALGAALCVFSTYVSIAFILAVQMNYAIAPMRRTPAPRRPR